MEPNDLTARGLRVQMQRWFVETGWTDGNGIGLWDTTDESVEVSNKQEAEALRDEWLASGKIERNQWGELRRASPYGAFRIRSLWEDAAPDALLASPAVQALIAAAKAEGMEMAKIPDRRLSLVWIIENTTQIRVRDLALEIFNDIDAAIRAAAATLRTEGTKP